MEKAKAQLRAYYKAQGLTGSALGAAVWSDLCKFKRNVKAFCKIHEISQIAYCRALNSPIVDAFNWHDSPEGYEYWEEIHCVHSIH